MNFIEVSFIILNIEALMNSLDNRMSFKVVFLVYSCIIMLKI